MKVCKSIKMRIKAILIDLSGTLHIEDQPTENAISALKKLRTNKNLLLRFVTNTTKESNQTLCNRLSRIGFDVKQSEIFSSLTAASKYVKKNNLNPFYLLSTDALVDFPRTDVNKEHNAVVVGLAPDKFYYENMNKAFNILLKKHPLIAVHEGKYYKRADGMALGPGCFIKGLEFSTNCNAIVIGKPNDKYFRSVIPQTVLPEECFMIGDDIVDDIKGAMDIGIKGILVKTGKYMPDFKTDIQPTYIMDNFSVAVDWILENCE